MHLKHEPASRPVVQFKYLKLDRMNQEEQTHKINSSSIWDKTAEGFANPLEI